MNRQKEMNSLKHILSKYDKRSVYIGIMKYSLENKNDDFCFAVTDYLCLMTSRYGDLANNKSISYNQLTGAIEIAKKMIMSYSFDGFDTPNAHLLPDEVKKSMMHKVLMRTKLLLHRGDGYQIQIIDFANKLYSPMREEMLECFGFTMETYIGVLIMYFSELSKMMTIHNLYFGSMFDENGAIESTFKNFGYLHIPIKKLKEEFPCNEINSLMERMSENIDYRMDADEPIGFNQFISKPFIVSNQSIIVPTIHTALYNIHKQFHYDFIISKAIHKNKERDKIIKSKYKKHRGDLVETLVLDALSKFEEIKNSTYQSLFHYEGKDRYEADVTVQFNDTTILFECKGKLLTLNSLKGDIDSIRDDYSKMITYAYEQAKRTEDRIRGGLNFSFNKSDITLKTTSKYYKIPIIVDHMGFVSTTDRDFFGNHGDSPLPINIYDFEMICKEINNFNQFINYLEYRETNYEKLVASDELEIFEFYYDGNIPNNSNDDRSTPLGYTERLDNEMNKAFAEFVLKYPFRTVV